MRAVPRAHIKAQNKKTESTMRRKMISENPAVGCHQSPGARRTVSCQFLSLNHLEHVRGCVSELGETVVVGAAGGSFDSSINVGSSILIRSVLVAVLYFVLLKIPG